MSKCLTICAALAIAPPAAAQNTVPNGPREFRLDAGHSQVAFSVGFLGHTVRGWFDDVRGAILYAVGAPESSSVTVVIATKSVSTGSAHRDAHLRSPDFFDAAAYPSIVFRSRQVRRVEDGYAVTGPLTMHGVTREVTIPFRETPPVEDPHGSTVVYFNGALRLARKDFGILGGARYNDWFDALRSATMADSVEVTLDVEGWDPDYARIHAHDAALAKVAREGVAPTAARLRALQAQHPDTLRNAEYELDQVGRALLARGRTADALDLFRLTVELFPASAGAQASLARGYALAGARDSARASVARALAIDSLDPRALELRRRLH